VDSYCVESRFQLGMLRLLDEDMLVVDILDDVYVAVLGVDLHDDGFDGGVTIHEYAFFAIYCQWIVHAVVLRRSYPVKP
jgi:hypothetical protein